MGRRGGGKNRENLVFEPLDFSPIKMVPNIHNTIISSADPFASSEACPEQASTVIFCSG